MKMYSFTVNRGSKIDYQVIPEDKLNKRHIDLLLGELLLNFRDAPKIVQEKFITKITQ